MHDIWNPWHGCIKKSEGCEHCYMYYLDHLRNMDGEDIFLTNNLNYPLSKNKDGTYKIKSGETLRVCMTSDFFLKEADKWRDACWNIINHRQDVIFFLLTKRPERVKECLPSNWGDGYESVFFNVTCENQKRADERIPILLSLPFKHKGIMCAPFIGEINIEKYLATNQIERVVCGGENYDGDRVCNFDWVKSLRKQCEKYDVTFCFIETGTRFIKDNKLYILKNKRIQSEMAFKSKMNYQGKEINFILKDDFGNIIKKEKLYVPYFKDHCSTCGSKLICNGCAQCKKCSFEKI